MSLVAYGSSDESESEETSSPGRLFSVLPAPKTSGFAERKEGPNPAARDGRPSDPRSSTGGFVSSLLKPKKRTEPVKICVPQVQRRDSDSDEDEPAVKKLQAQGGGSGLSSLLPKPKNLTVKEKDRALVPHALTKRQEPKGPKPPAAPVQGLISSSASPSAIKAAAKSAALQVARQIATDDQENEEEMTPQNYFSLGESSQRIPDVVPNTDPEPGAPAEPCPYSATDEMGQSDAPLDFGGNYGGVGTWGGEYNQYQQLTAGPESFPQEYYDQAYYQESDPGPPEAEEPDQSDVFDDEGFMRLQGKRNRGKEEVKFLEIKGDDQLSGNQQWMTKNISEEKQTRQSYSKRKGDQPTGQQRRKHQITYLIHQAKERELELKNSWAENRMTRRQTQAKYGF